MENIKKVLYNLATSENELADEAANVYMLLEDADEREVAEYIASHDDDMRRLLGVKALASEDADKELGKEYFDLYSKGQAILNPDPYKRTDYYGSELKDIPHYMELLGVPKESGSYTTDQIAAFTNPESQQYYGKLDKDYLQGRAMTELGDAASADDLLRVLDRASGAYRNNRAQRGYRADNSTDIKMWLTDLGQELLAPRMREARLAGREWGWEDLLGDAAELGLSVVPGVGVVNKAGKVIARMPKGVQFATRLGGEALESAAVPFGSQVYDYAVYDEEDPRGQWDWGRVGAQYGGAIGAKGMIKMGARTAKDAANFSGGKEAEGGVKRLLDIAEDIGYDSKNAIRTRGAALEQRAKMADEPKYSDGPTLTSAQNEAGFFGSPDDGINWQDFQIRADEAQRLRKSNPARKQKENVEKEMPRNRDLDAYNEWHEKFKTARDNFNAANKSDYDIVQLPDGRFVYNKSGVVGGTKVTDNVTLPVWGTGAGNQQVPSEVTVLRQSGTGLPPSATKEYVFDLNRNEPVTQKVSYADRDKTVRKALSSDRDFEAIASGRAAWQKPVNTATNMVFNAGAREGIVGQGLNLDEKRQNALWNKQLMSMRPYVSDAQVSPKEKAARVDAIMDVLTYGGLDNLPEEVFSKAPWRYHDIANVLGSSDWKHWSEVKVKNEPTTSYSSAY